ncbi:MAG: hypothetical protein V4671_32715 [Armatimonadota bacterium]
MARFKVFYEFERDGGASAEQHTQLIEAADFEEAQSKALAELSKPCFIEEYTEMHVVCYPETVPLPASVLAL